MIQVASHLYVSKSNTDVRYLKERRIERTIILQKGGAEYQYEGKDESGIEVIRVRAKGRPKLEIINRILGMIVDPSTNQCLMYDDKAYAAGYIIAIYRMRVQGWSLSRAHDEWVGKTHRPLCLFYWWFGLRQWSKGA